MNDLFAKFGEPEIAPVTRKERGQLSPNER
jgi:hypothetical protein